MRLGNSFGNNKGKKYFIRGKHDVNNDIVYADKAERFNKWFAGHYYEIYRFMCDKNIMNEDAMNDTYVRMYEIILYSGLEVKDYKSYFIRSFYTNHINDSMKQNRYCELNPNFDRADMDTEHYLELEKKQKKLEDDIFGYIYNSYNIHEFELFKMYVTLKPAINYNSLADITNLKAHEIQRTISKIKKDLRRNKEFEKRRKEVM